jgi:hypothetical protein
MCNHATYSLYHLLFTRMAACQLVTANDNPGRDPVSWSLSRLGGDGAAMTNGASEWELLDRQARQHVDGVWAVLGGCL